MKVLGIYGSPRKGGNSDLLLDEALKGAEAAGAEVSSIRCWMPGMKLSGCIECGSCDETGECVLADDMQEIYPKLVEADVIILSVPMFFYGPPAQAKALMDRCQALWSKRMLEKNPEARKKYVSGRGYLLAVGATKGKTLFDGTELAAKYFYDALDMSYEGGVFVRGVEKKGDMADRSEDLKAALDLGRRAVEEA